jgi:fatty acid amide hydrolase 2
MRRIVRLVQDFARVRGLGTSDVSAVVRLDHSPSMNPLFRLSAAALARRLRNRSVSSHELVLAHLRRIQEVNPALNAVVQDRFVAALAEAARADERLARGDADLPPFFGVPCTIKEAFALEGMPNTGGLVARRGRPATRDATAVARLRAAGAIPMGVTNVSELCMWMESANCVYGRTNNPYDPSRTAGGSSGGEGAIIGAGASPFGLGSDVGGSIRMPAFFCGIFGHKPSGGLVPNTGQFPIAENEALRYLTTGPLCRRAEDLWPLLRVLAGSDGEDARRAAIPLGDPAQVAIEGLRVVVVRRNGIVAIDPPLESALDRAAEALAARGARVVEARLDRLARSLEMWSSMLDAAGGQSFAALMGEGTAIRPIVELVRWMLRRSDHTLPAIVLALLEKVPERLPMLAGKMVAETRELQHDVMALLDPGGVMLYPPFPKLAPRHHLPLLSPLDFAYTAVFNVLENPVTQVPLGLDSATGLPLGVQVVARHGEDHAAIAVANALESLFGGWVPPPGAP